jgi:hypothetical protein
MVVEIGGTSRRPGGGTYHITWSLGPGREARESNDVIAAHGWEPFNLVVPLRLQPQRFKAAPRHLRISPAIQSLVQLPGRSSYSLACGGSHPGNSRSIAARMRRV